MKPDAVKIRMYRHGFGDCFLLRYFHEKTCLFSMLIDCGLKLNDSVAGITLADVAKNIADVLCEDNNSTRPFLDVLVVTHEHWDHVSGFQPEQKLFDHFKIGKIWMAWTESPVDEEAVFIRKHITKGIKALKVANEKLKTSPSASPSSYATTLNSNKLMAARADFGKAIEDIAAFFGPLGVTKTASGISLKDKYEISLNSLKAMEHVKSFSKKESGIEYHYPGDLIDLKNKLPGVRIYVLGPPKSKLLNKENPSAGAKKEVYMGLDDTSLTGFVNGLLQMTDEESGLTDSAPFAEVDMDIASDAKNNPLYKYYFDSKEKYRTIEDEWLNNTGALAMQLDSDTNNTSLALAIEFVESGKVLLFPADAQVGSWLSWHDLSWQVTVNGKKEEKTVTDLLNNTVFYKAGHHASHNATLKELGLELMTSDELVVFIPEKEKQYNGIPYAPLVERMKEKSRGRTFFSADSNEPPDRVLKKKPASLSREEWDAFKKNCQLDPMFIEYTISVS